MRLKRTDTDTDAIAGMDRDALTRAILSIECEFPVDLTEGIDLTFGGFYGGSPFLGALGSLPPGEGGLHPNGGFGFMWHSHTEKEIVNFDIFPGGMMTMLIIEHPDVPIMGMD